ncbi:MAG: HAMP domain-containing histidine kinase [Muribaculum sp.]|nr:HAMP domain-containing histidine kinase [Muribaculum sp.]
MANIYDTRRYGTIAFFIVAAVLVLVFLGVSDNIARQLSSQERDRMEIWADATKAIVNSPSDVDDAPQSADLDFLLSIIERNRNIPLLLTDQDGNIIDHRNFDLPEPVDSASPLYISDRNKAFLQSKLRSLRHSPNVIQIEIAPGLVQNLYYEDSRLLKLLSYYPYVQVLVMLAFVALVYFAVMTTKKAEQNKVWVGLSKETAHQLGTPISSLMAWMELLESMGVDKDITGEMNKDVNRLTTIASRFGKIGSRPAMEPVDVNVVVDDAVKYMSTRISKRIGLEVHCSSEPLVTELSDSLFQWVMENLIKNAVDAMDAEGSITVTTCREDDMARIDVADTGKGLPRKRFKTIFNPGYTTKKRGWGLGLALAKRIIEQYHGGRIFVASSEPGFGTTFRILLPLCI